jgi:hypothetical protein
LTEAEKIIQEELSLMVTQDNFKHPFKGMKEVKKPAQGFLEINPLYIEEAR